jgi:hypothetical protein
VVCVVGVGVGVGRCCVVCVCVLVGFVCDVLCGWGWGLRH